MPLVVSSVCAARSLGRAGDPQQHLELGPSQAVLGVLRVEFRRQPTHGLEEQTHGGDAAVGEPIRGRLADLADRWRAGVPAPGLGAAAAVCGHADKCRCARESRRRDCGARRVPLLALWR
jgi:hypothetical protein